MLDSTRNGPAQARVKNIFSMNAADLLCVRECRQTRDRTNGHLIDGNTLLS